MKIGPSKEQFKKLSKRNNIIVFSAKLYADWLTPLSAYHGLSKKLKGESFLLESVEGEEKICRFSFLGFEPLCTFKSKGRKISITNKKTTTFTTKRDPIHELKKLMGRYKVAPKEHLRFFGGFVGYVGYDMVRFYEPVGKDLPDPLNMYDSYLILPKYLIIFDHLKHQVEILSFVEVGKAKNVDNLYAKEKRQLQKVADMVMTPHKLSVLSMDKTPLRISSNFAKPKFLNAVKKIKRYIKEGDIIQAVPSQRFSTKFKGSSFTAYRYLRMLNPSPYMMYLNFKGLQIAGSSPEMLLRCEDNILTTHPIAGTRKRGVTTAGDNALAKDLLKDPKERAEHVMLVDLARNDLGRVATKSSVCVPRFMDIERFSHVMHIVSEVRAKLNKNEDIYSSFVSCFPAGTVSGAPKVRAMQIINEVEPQKRGIYAGSIGYFSFTKSLDTCIIIRTLVFKNGKAYVQAGAGIVNDSIPEREYKETVNKAKALVVALEYAYNKK